MLLVLILLLLPRFSHAQVTTHGDFTGTSTADAINHTHSLLNTTLTPERPSSTEPPRIEPTPSEAPDWSPAENYLSSGDPSVLQGGKCSRSYSPPELKGPLPESFYAPLEPAMNALANTANFLNMVFQASDLRESTVREDMEWYHALVRALLEADLLIGHALLTFDADPAAQVPQLVLRASRNLTPKVQSILLQDLSRAWKSLHPPAPAPDDSWYRGFKFSHEPTAALSKRVLLNDLTTLDTPKWGQSDSYVTNRSGVRWGNAPFLECKNGRFLPRWMLTLSTSFYGLKPDLTPEFRGVIRVDVNIQDFDVNQCVKGPGWFTNTHQCNRTSMECVPRSGRGFRLGQYCCRCKMGYYSPPTHTGANGTGDGSICYPHMPVCLPCWPGCKSCEDGSPCLARQNRFLRVWMLVIQGFTMILVFLSMLAAYQHRHSRRIRASGLLLLETILFGSLLLYFPVFILYFKPSTFRCILLRWMRMLGFSIVYGTVTLKLYRVLRVFLSRTAQRTPYLSSIHLLRMLGVMLVAVVWFLCAWTVCVLQNRERNIPVFVTTTTSDGQGFLSCYVDRWDDMMAVAELLLLCWGCSLCSAVKPVPSAYHEPRYMGFAVHNELLLSTMFHLLRFFFPSLHPDWTLMLFFAHTHVTITVTLALLFVPKFLHASRPKREEIAAEVYEDEVDLRRCGTYFNSSFCSAYSDPSLDPDDIREELKKLYSQLEVNKTKRMASNNPHLPKTRASRCLSIVKSLVAPLSRQSSRREEDKMRRSVHYTESSRGGLNIQADPSSRRGSALSVNFREPSYVDYSNSSRRCSALSINYRESSSPVHISQSERNPSLRETNAITSKRNSQRSMTDSLDIPPGVPKSLSAQNLTLDNNLLHPDQYKLQKSLSLKSNHSVVDIPPIKVDKPKADAPQVDTAATVVTKSSPASSVVIKSSPAPSVVTKASPEVNTKDQKAAVQASQSVDKGDVCPWDAPPVEVDLTAKLICPWEYIPPPPPPKPAESEPQSPVSASAPVSPMTKTMSASVRGVSLKNTTQKWLSVKKFKQSSLDVKIPSPDSISQKSHESETRERTPSITSSKSPAHSRNPSVERRYVQRKSITSIDGKPLLTKQNAIRMSSTDSTDKSPRHNWPSRQNSNHSHGSWETGGIASRTPSTHRTGSGRYAPGPRNSQANICPWDVPQSESSGNPDVCPWEVEDTPGRGGVCPWETQDVSSMKRKDSGRADVCPWDTQDAPATSNIPVTREVLQQRNQSLHAPTQLSVKRDNANPSVCPWEVQGSEAIYQNVNPLENQRQHMAESNVPLPGKSAESCPWEFPEPPKIVTDVCPWEETGPPPPIESHGSITLKVDVCPWDTLPAPKADNDSPRQNVCPWDAEQPDKTEAPQIVSVHLEKTKQQDSVCPWETGEPEKMSTSRSTDTLKIQDDTVKANVCPWETAEPETTKNADVCPWETGEQEPQKMTSATSTDTIRIQDVTAKANVCPWETAEPETMKKPDVCPWEVDESKAAPVQPGSRGEACPWEEVDEPKAAPVPPGTRGEACPWETEETTGPKHQDDTKANVCPWETEQPSTLRVGDSAKANVCPWEVSEGAAPNPTEIKIDAPDNGNDAVTGDLQRRLSTEEVPAVEGMAQSDESNGHTPLDRRDSLCPWALERSRSGSFTDASDVFTWEPENIPEEEEEEADAECAAEACFFPADL